VGDSATHSVRYGRAAYRPRRIALPLENSKCDPLVPDYRRYRVAGGTYFFTVNLLQRYPNDLLVRYIELLRTVVREVRKNPPFHIDACVTLPDHLHCVWTLATGR
jgi:hypothetical protein